MDVFDLHATIRLDTKEYEQAVKGASADGQQLAKSWSGFGQKISAAFSVLGKAAVAGAGAATAAVGVLTKSSLDAYSSFEQLTGGVETLFKESADTVMEYADNAYKTAGMSANQYMETVTGFSATLLQGLAGDTEAAAEYADLAITDMADNANKMGTAMQSIQYAYQGFAKDNYTMLDNLKLGYGGTQAEMARLINDSGVLGDAIQVTADTVAQVPFDKIIEAIHVIQTQLGITGTTAAEAATTIEGSVNSMKAAWENLLTGIADENANLPELVEQFADSFETAMDNVMPRIVQIFGGIGDAVLEAAPIIAEQVPTMLENAFSSLGEVASEQGVQIILGLVQGIGTALPEIANAAVDTVSGFIINIINNLPAIANVGGQIIGQLIVGLFNVLVNLEVAVGQIVAAIIDFFLSGDFIDVGVQIISGLIQGFVDALPNLVSTVINAVGDLVESAKQVARDGWNAVQSIMSGEAVRDVGAAIDSARNPYHRGSERDQSYWEQVGQHYASTGQDQKNGDYSTTAERAAASTYDFSAALDALSSAGSKTAKQTETLADKLDDAHSALSASQQAYKTLAAAVEEYNTTGSVSLATWQDLMDLAPEYQKLLVQEGDKLAINQAAYNELTAAQRLEIETLAQANGVLPETIQLIDSLGIAMEKTADEAELAAKQLDDALEKLSEDWSNSTLSKLKDAASNILGGNFGDALVDASEVAWKLLDTATQQQLVDLAQGWLDTLETAFAQDGFKGLAKAGKTIAESLAAGLQDTSSVTGALINNVLGQVGISGGVEGLLSTIAELGPIVLGVVGVVAAVAAGVAGVAAAFSYTVDQSRALQEQVQALTEDGKELTDELSAALDVLQPIMDQIDGMLIQLDQITSMFTDTFKGIGVEIMETMIPIIQQILDIIQPALENLQPALEAVGDLLRTLLELFGNLIISVLTALQPILEAIGPLLETLAELLNVNASIISAMLSPALKALGELLSWLLKPIQWVAQAINNAVEWIVSLINPLLKFLGLGTISLPDSSAINKGNAISSIGSSVGDYVTPSTSTGTSSGGTTIQKVEIYIDGAQYQDPQSLAEAISIQLQNLTERKVNVFA